jgi:hypothetical protein
LLVFDKLPFFGKFTEFFICHLLSLRVKNFRRANVAEIRIKIESQRKKNGIYLALSEGAVMIYIHST